jgi:inward rectifier potassium channel
MLIILTFYITINFFLQHFITSLVLSILMVLHSDSELVVWTVYFFSAQTFTTVGYGHISPTGF